MYKRISCFVLQDAASSETECADQENQPKESTHSNILTPKWYILKKGAIMSCLNLIVVIGSDDFLHQPISGKETQNIYAHWDHYMVNTVFRLVQ